MRKALTFWGIGAYRFEKYKNIPQLYPKIFISNDLDYNSIENMVKAVYLIQDLINTPSEDMGPEEIAHTSKDITSRFDAQIKIVKDRELLLENYPSIFMVGRSSSRTPCLIDITWGDPENPKVTLVGKGVCFDSGGLDLKRSDDMNLMKKDMAGAAHALGLGYLIMAANLPIRLRLLIPAVDNVISGNAYKRGDIITTRKGIKVEVGSTDAEGRLILSDALTEACSEKPQLLIDFSTLTGAALAAVGTEISAFMSNNETLAQTLMEYGKQENDPLWQLPLYKPYKKYLENNICEINSTGSSPYAGAIMAGLFLNEFVLENIPWVHFDFMAWNTQNTLGREEGGQTMAIRAVFRYIKEMFK